MDLLYKTWPAGTRHRHEPLRLGIWGICFEWCSKTSRLILSDSNVSICFRLILLRCFSLSPLSWWGYIKQIVDGYFVVQVCKMNSSYLHQLWYYSSSSWSIIWVRRTMSLVRSHASSTQNFFMVIVRFLETFVGSMSAGQRWSSSLWYLVNFFLSWFKLNIFPRSKDELQYCSHCHCNKWCLWSY